MAGSLLRLRALPSARMTEPIVTEKRDLRSGEPLWLGTARIGVACGRRLSGTRFDVVIVGAGISGAMLAYRLRRRGNQRARRRPPAAASRQHGCEHGAAAVRDRHTALRAFPHDRPEKGGTRMAALGQGRRGAAAIGEARADRLRLARRDIALSGRRRLRLSRAQNGGRGAAGGRRRGRLSDRRRARSSSLASIATERS